MWKADCPYHWLSHFVEFYGGNTSISGNFKWPTGHPYRWVEEAQAVAPLKLTWTRSSTGETLGVGLGWFKKGEVGSNQQGRSQVLGIWLGILAEEDRKEWPEDTKSWLDYRSILQKPFSGRDTELLPSTGEWRKDVTPCSSGSLLENMEDSWSWGTWEKSEAFFQLPDSFSCSSPPPFWMTASSFAQRFPFLHY